ncbi:MAG: histidinol dehydrogenase [Thermoanaerobaculia bacterium]
MSALRIVLAESPAGLGLRRRIALRLATVLDAKVEKAVRRIVSAIRKGGDAALVQAVRTYDGFTAAAAVADLRLAPLPEDRGWRNIPPDVSAAVDLAIANVERFHRAQLAAGGDGFVVESPGVTLAEIVRPLARVGLYVPGGRASYPSTALMTVVPARVAGVAEIVVATPARTYLEQPVLRYTLACLGVEEIWGVGGAHAIAALAYGTESVRRVDAIAGPGNAWVTAAKRQVGGRVAIDGLMGPSEVVIVADEESDPEWIAADLLAQAEHDPRAAALLVTTSRALARRVAEAMERQLRTLATAETARAALGAYGGALLVADLDAAIALADEIAPEHLQLVGAEIEAGAGRYSNAGAIFVGARTPEVFGDYVAGPSHVLPTCGTARFASGLTVETFRRRTHRIEVHDAAAATRFATAAAALATAEGLPAHAAAAAARRGAA